MSTIDASIVSYARSQLLQPLTADFSKINSATQTPEMNTLTLEIDSLTLKTHKIGIARTVCIVVTALASTVVVATLPVITPLVAVIGGVAAVYFGKKSAELSNKAEQLQTKLDSRKTSRESFFKKPWQFNDYGALLDSAKFWAPANKHIDAMLEMHSITQEEYDEIKQQFIVQWIKVFCTFEGNYASKYKNQFEQNCLNGSDTLKDAYARGRRVILWNSFHSEATRLGTEFYNGPAAFSLLNLCLVEKILRDEDYAKFKLIL